jgi:hypothetical protein
MHLASSLLALALQAASPPAEGVGISDCHFGEVYEFHVASCVLQVGNGTNQTIRLKVTPRDPRDRAPEGPVEIAPGSTGSIELKVGLGNQVGDIYRFFSVSDVDGTGKPLVVRAIGFGMSALEDPNPTVDFGTVNVLADGASKSVRLESHDSPVFGLTRVLSGPDQLTARVTGGNTVQVGINKDANWGLLDDYVKLELNSDRQSQAWIRVKADVQGDVVPLDNPVWMGVVAADQKREAIIRLESRSGKEIRIGKLSMEDMAGETEVSDCEPKSDGCKSIRLTVSPAQAPGPLRGSLIVELPDYSRDLVVSVWGVLQARTKSPTNPQGTETKPVLEKWPVAASDMAEATASADARPSAAGATGPLLKWAVADDRGVHGYQVFRAESKDGPFLLQNSKTILANGKEGAVSRYEWRDPTAQKGRSYWYYIGAVGKSGDKRKLSEPQEKVVD